MRKTKWITLVHAVVIVCYCLILQGCGTSEKQNRTSGNLSNEQKFNGERNQVVKYSEEKKYRVSLYTDAFPLTVGKIHSWLLQVTSLQGDPIDNVKIYVHGGMPAHQHGFPTHPRVTRYLGNGRYVVEGMKFSMTGDWEIRFNIKEEKKRDRVIFNLTL